jgi:hypothetical protein
VLHLDAGSALLNAGAGSDVFRFSRGASYADIDDFSIVAARRG